MTDLRDFLTKNKKQIHQLLNHMWRTIEELFVIFEQKISDGDLDNSHGNLVKIDDGWDESLYANPTISFPFGEIGYSLDGLYCAFAIFIEELSEQHLEEILLILQDSPEIKGEIYGADDCFTTFLNTEEEIDFTEALAKIKDSEESIVQIDLSVNFMPEIELLSQYIDIITKIYNYLQDKELLTNLSIYTFDEEEEIE